MYFCGFYVLFFEYRPFDALNRILLKSFHDLRVHTRDWKNKLSWPKGSNWPLSYEKG